MTPPWIDNTRDAAVWRSIIFYKLKFIIEYGSKIKILLFEFELFENIGTGILVEVIFLMVSLWLNYKPVKLYLLGLKLKKTLDIQIENC